MSQFDELLMAINALVDNAHEWKKVDIEAQAEAIQRLAEREHFQMSREKCNHCGTLYPYQPGGSVFCTIGCKQDAEEIVDAEDKAARRPSVACVCICGPDEQNEWCHQHGRLDDLAHEMEERRAEARERAAPGSGAADDEPPHLKELREIAEEIRARGDCGCTVVLRDGTLATFSLNIPDPYAAVPFTSAAKEKKT